MFFARGTFVSTFYFIRQLPGHIPPGGILLDGPEEDGFAGTLAFPQLADVLFLLVELDQVFAFVLHHEEATVIEFGYKIRIELAG